LAARLTAERAAGRTPVLTAVDGGFWGALLAADIETSESCEAIARLQRLGLRVVLLSGDTRATAEAVARRVGIPQVIAEMRPDQKHAVIEELRGAGHVVAMVGDGINDAPALAAADLGIAIGSGADVAIETAHVVLVRHDLRSVVQAIRLARATLSTIRQNLVWAFLYNLVLLPLAAGLLIPAFRIQLPPALAAAAMAASSVSVVTNSLLLRLRPLE
jgi:Cu+-exporting ATPase